MLFIILDINGVFRYNLKAVNGRIPKWLKGLAWKASRTLNGREGSNPSSSAIYILLKDKISFFISTINRFTYKIDKTMIKPIN